MDGKTHNEFMAAIEHIAEAFVKQRRYEIEHKRERSHEGWVAAERVSLVRAANEWSDMYDLPVRVRIGDVISAEQLATGHVDYNTKMPLYIAQVLYGIR